MKKNKDFEFNVGVNDTIALQLHGLYNVTSCSRVPIVLKTRDNTITLSECNLEGALECFTEKLQKALNHELKIEPSLSTDLGYLWNEVCRGKPDLHYGEDGLWIPWERCCIWSSVDQDKMYDSWIYNDQTGAIVLEITPRYPWADEQETSANYVAYEEWIKKYKPFLVINIQSDVATKWLEQAQDILRQIEANNVHMEHYNSHEE